MRTALLAAVSMAAVSLWTQSAQAGALDFEERVAGSRALKQVEWRHTLWPEQNKTLKPAFEDVVSDAVLRREAEDALLKSKALEHFWGRPVTASALQAEIERMVRSSRRPEVLGELFAALGDDPLRIAECLARPLLADRLVRAWYARDERFHGALRAWIEARLREADPAGSLRDLGGMYREVEVREISVAEGSPARHEGLDLEPEAWGRYAARLAQDHGARSPDDVPLGRMSPLREDDTEFNVRVLLERGPKRLRVATVVWEKTTFDRWWSETRGELERAGAPWIEERAAYRIPTQETSSCEPDTWTPTRQDVPDRRYHHTAVWTGTEMIVWGGFNEVYNTDELATGGRYDPATDTWAPTSTGTHAPMKRMRHTAVWTGTEMIVWGGSYDGGMLLDTGARYDPRTDSWSPLPRGGSTPAARDRHTAVWTGAEMIVWGGVGIYGNVNTGGCYVPAGNAWIGLPTMGAPAARYNHSAVWTGTQMIVWGGYNLGPLSTGARFNPVDGSWAATGVAGAPTAREQHTAVWTGSEMIVWGGLQSGTVLDTGARYDPATDVWTATSTANAPSARNAHTAIWTGSQMIVWGGVAWTYPNYASGGRYTPSSNSWTATATASAPGARRQHTAVWTGSEMIVWGGRAEDMVQTGGRYSPASDSWVATAAGSDAAAARFWHTAVWTGSRMIVWGGYDDVIELDTGSRYDLATDSWAPTSMGAGVPSRRRHHTAIWTGTRMIVWGGWPGTSPALNTGAEYDPLNDAWTPTSTGASVPSGRNDHTAVWTGTEMIVWGGYPVAGLTNTGGRYAPSSDSWTPTSTGASVPAGRRYHTAVWTGAEMIVWGGETSLSLTTTQTGGRYAPASDTWLPTSTGANVPGANSRHVGVWTGNRMVVWGAGTPNGGRYDPATDTWLPVAGTGAPTIRSHGTAVWTGTEMIVWGGASHTSTGGRYNPVTNAWIPTGTGENTPAGRTYHTAVWTGSEDRRMLVWGGEPVTQTGRLYCGASCTPATFYRDVDGDGFGGSVTTTMGCSAPPGYVASSTDCADADANNFPGNAEVCDGWDNDCDFVIDTDAVPPTGVPALAVWKYGPALEISWPGIAGADRYDLAKGWMSTLRGTAGDYTAALGVCANDVTVRRVGDAQVPTAGDGFWYLVRAENCNGNGSWDEGVPSQGGSRDAEIAASPVGCP